MQFSVFLYLLVPLCPFVSYTYYPGMIFWISCWKLERIREGFGILSEYIQLQNLLNDLGEHTGRYVDFDV